MKVRFYWKVVLKFRDLRNFHEIYTVSHLWSNLQKKNWGKKILNVNTAKLLLKNKVSCFWGFLIRFSFKLCLKVNIHPIHDFFTCYCLKMACKIGNISKFIKELEVFKNWTIDDKQ